MILIVTVLIGAFNKENALAGAIFRNCENFADLRLQLYIPLVEGARLVDVPQLVGGDLVREVLGRGRGQEAGGRQGQHGGHGDGGEREVLLSAASDVLLGAVLPPPLLPTV